MGQPTTNNYARFLGPLLTKMGVDLTYEVGSHGLFPDIVGRAGIELRPMPAGEALKPIMLTERGTSPHLEVHITFTEGQAEGFYNQSAKPILEKFLQNSGLPFNLTVADPIKLP